MPICFKTEALQGTPEPRRQGKGQVWPWPQKRCDGFPPAQLSVGVVWRLPIDFGCRIVARGRFFSILGILAKLGDVATIRNRRMVRVLRPQGKAAANV